MKKIQACWCESAPGVHGRDKFCIEPVFCTRGNTPSNSGHDHEYEEGMCRHCGVFEDLSATEIKNEYSTVVVLRGDFLYFLIEDDYEEKYLAEANRDLPEEAKICFFTVFDETVTDEEKP
jgi:hypothetical protein